MTVELGTYTFEILIAYFGTAVLLLGLILASFLHAKRVKRSLKEHQGND